LLVVSVALVLAVAGVALLLTAGVVLRSVGPGFRIGRLLSATRQVPIEEAQAIARAGEPRYVRVDGRISSDEEFPDDRNRPLVYRRTRLQIAQAESWTSIVDEREAIPFGVETRQSFIAVDEAVLGDGLVVIPRVSAGRVRDLPPDLSADVPKETNPDAEARLTIEQLSAVEHATVVGQPVERDGTPMMTSGLGRPLIVTVLDQPAQMRILAAGRRTRVIAAAVSLALGMGLLAAAVVALLVGV
jgi:hypothetical protein